MKTLRLLLLIALGMVSASAQVVLDTADVLLTSTGTTTIINTSGNASSGQLMSIACSVTQGVDGVFNATLKVALAGGGSTTTYPLYVSSLWDATLIPFVTLYSVSGLNYSMGENQYDAFVLPFNVPYTNGLSITVNVSSTTALDGTLTCSALHT